MQILRDGRSSGACWVCALTRAKKKRHACMKKKKKKEKKEEEKKNSQSSNSARPRAKSSRARQRAHYPYLPAFLGHFSESVDLLPQVSRRMSLARLFSTAALPSSAVALPAASTALSLPTARRVGPVSHRMARRVRGHIPLAARAPPLPPALQASERWSVSSLLARVDGAKMPISKEELPASVARAASPSRGLPVYARGVGGGRSSLRTVVRGVTGDVPAFAAQLAAALGGARVRVAGVASARASGAAPSGATPVALEVDGHRVAEVKAWLTGLGM